MIRNIWIKWETDPVIITFAEEMIPIQSIAFPTVTICPVTKSQVDKLNFTDTYHMLKEGHTANVSEER